MFKWVVFSVYECFSFNGTVGVVECVDGLRVSGSLSEMIMFEWIVFSV